VTTPNQLPFLGALDAVHRIEAALTQRDAALAASDDALDAAHTEAEALLSAARVAGTRAGDTRRDTILARAHADAEAIRSDGDAEVRQLGRRVSAERDRLAGEFARLLMGES
jgi:hypothetical protein